jgi:pimeloyl-ACP methyl ester carboxylesterase
MIDYLKSIYRNRGLETLATERQSKKLKRSPPFFIDMKQHSKKIRNSKTIHYVVQGNGPPVILLHGVAASLYDWEALQPDLASTGYRVYAIDLPGHGESYKPQDPQDYLASKVFKVIEDWIADQDLQEPAILIGHSLGGYFSLLYALRHPQRVHRLVLIDPFYSPKQLSPLLRRINRRPDWSEKALRFTPEWLVNIVLGLDPTSRNHFSENARMQIAADYKRASPHIMYTPGSIDDLTPDLQAILQPSLVIWGAKDLTLDTGTFPALVSTLPNAAGYTLVESGHQPHIGKPQRVKRLILNFLNQPE